MGRSYNLKSELKVFKKEEGKEKLKQLLLECCDEDFNGNNGEEYFTTEIVDGEEVEMSNFDAVWMEVKNMDMAQIIEHILNANYEEDWDYHDYKLDVIDREDEIIFNFSVIY